MSRTCMYSAASSHGRLPMHNKPALALGYKLPVQRCYGAMLALIQSYLSLTRAQSSYPFAAAISHADVQLQADKWRKRQLHRVEGNEEVRNLLQAVLRCGRGQHKVAVLCGSPQSGRLALRRQMYAPCPCTGVSGYRNDPSFPDWSETLGADEDNVCAAETNV
jgi:hypothetical protein